MPADAAHAAAPWHQRACVLIREMEWASIRHSACDHESTDAACPCCDNTRTEGHTDDCELAALIAHAHTERLQNRTSVDAPCS